MDTQRKRKHLRLRLGPRCLSATPSPPPSIIGSRGELRCVCRRFQEIIHDFSSPTESSQLGRPSSIRFRERENRSKGSRDAQPSAVCSLIAAQVFLCLHYSLNNIRFIHSAELLLASNPQELHAMQLTHEEHHVQTRFQVPDEVLASAMAVVPFTSTSVSTSNYSMLQPAPTLLLLPVVSCCCCSSGIRL